MSEKPIYGAGQNFGLGKKKLKTAERPFFFSTFLHHYSSFSGRDENSHRHGGSITLILTLCDNDCFRFFTPFKK